MWKNAKKSKPNSELTDRCGGQAVGRGVPREHQQRRHGALAADLRRSGLGQHLVHPGPPRLRLPHHGVQLAGRQDPRRQARPTRSVNTQCYHAIVSISLCSNSEHKCGHIIKKKVTLFQAEASMVSYKE